MSANVGGTLREGRIVGRGASDTKSSVACQVYAAAVLKEAGILRSDLSEFLGGDFDAGLVLR